MAEVVNDFQERSIPEYEQLRKYQIFTDEKIKGIIKSRENYQYKLSKNTKSLKDYGEYIIYEKKIHSMVVAVEEARKEVYPGLRAAMANRIIRLYKEAIRGFPDESRLWEAYLKFCKNNYKPEVPAAYERILQKQGDNPLHWCNAAMYFHGQNKEEERVKSYFFRGLQRHPDNEMLHTAFFKVLLMDTAEQPPEFQAAGLERVTALYNSAKKKVCNVHFLMNLLNLLEDDNYAGFSKPLQKLLITDMMHLYPREEVVWDLLAQRELRGITMSEFLDEQMERADAMDTKENEIGKMDNASDKKQDEKKRIEICFSIYQTAVETLKTPLMWSMFINAMMELNKNPATLVELKRKKLAYAFKGAQENSSLSETHYHAYINLLIETNSDKDFIIQVLNEAAENYNSSKLWEQHLSFYMRQGDEKKVYELFRAACIKLKDVNCSGMWDVVLQYYQTLYDEHYDKLLKIYKEAASRREPEFLPFRLQFLDFTIANHTICQARRLYADLTMIKPPYMDLHKKMEAVELKYLKQCSNPNPVHLRQVHENIVNSFGEARTDVWINYIKFEREFGEPKRSMELCERAKSTLLPRYVENFITEYCLLAVKK